MTAPSSEQERTGASGVPLVALAAALWGTDALFRRGLALELPATSVVVWEHVVLVVATLPLLVRVPWRRLTGADWTSLVLIGAGASALATVLFTAGFRYGDPNTLLLLQKLQPFVAIIGARVLLGERLRPRFGWWLAGAVASAWLITFSDPLDVRASAAIAGALGAGSAALWGLGTVLGRRMSGTLDAPQLTAARFAFGLPAALLLAAVGPGRVESLAIGASDVVPLLLLSLVPGLLALTLYYRGLRSTPASAATLAELAFPLTALLVNRIAFGATVTATQLVGIGALSALLIGMSVVGQRPEGLGIRAPAQRRALAHDGPGPVLPTS